MTVDALTKSYEVNLRGPVFLVQEALPHLKASSHAAVLNVVSVGAFIFSPMLSIYSSMKAAMMSFTRSMAAEFAHHGIRVNAIAPGPVDTYMMQQNPQEADRRHGRRHADETAGHARRDGRCRTAVVFGRRQLHDRHGDHR